MMKLVFNTINIKLQKKNSNFLSIIKMKMKLEDYSSWRGRQKSLKQFFVSNKMQKSSICDQFICKIFAQETIRE